MDYFKVNKYSSVEENILYISSNIIELLKGSEKEFGKLVKSRLLCKMLYNVFTISTYQN